MWGGMPAQEPPRQQLPGMPMYGGAGGMAQQPPPQQQQQQQQLNMNAGGGGGSGNNPKHDIFVGNLAFNTTEDQLHQAFSEIGRVLNVRLVSDLETGKPRGFAFVEFEDPQAALSAIRNMNDYELNGRKLRVNFSNSSHLEALANKLGMDLTQQTQQRSSSSAGAAAGAPGSASAGGAATQGGGGTGTNAVADALKGFSKGEMYDVVAKLKEIADRDPDEARRLIAGHPQLPEALLFLMSKLDMVKTPVASAEASSSALSSVMLQPAASAARPADPRARAADPRMQNAPAAAPAIVPPPPVPAAAQPQQQPPKRVDPRQRLDPRQKAQAQQVPPPPPPPPRAGLPPPPPPPPAGNRSGYGPGAAALDPSLVQQVMSLTPQQIQQLPPDKQQSILALRQQITGGAPGM